MKCKVSFLKNEAGQVLGLPMYLIIVMIVAVAVIAAVIFMIPQGTKTMSAKITSGSAQTGTIQSDGTVTFSSINVQVKVTTNDDRRDPIIGATVRLVGGGTTAEGVTDTDGIATISVSNANLDVGVNQACIKMTVKASSYEDFEDDTAVILYRP